MNRFTCYTNDFVEWKIVDIPTSFIWIIVLFKEVFQYGDGAKF
jgi:hypothetical protein